jgi:mannose-6-phosphate isomerase-like protein (cupin superfamily)
MPQRSVFSVPIAGTSRYQRLIPGAPQTMGIKAGCVTLQPGESVGEHVTDRKEEVVVLLEGVARVWCHGKEHSLVQAPAAVYIPPQTPHDLQNAGSTPLRYVFVVTPVENNDTDAPPSEV